jgi:phospholipase D1/2
MGWSDLSVCLEGPIVEDLRAHFVQRWNYIYHEKYSADKERNYEPLTMGPTAGTSYHADGSNVHHGAHKERITDDTNPSTPAHNPQNEGQSHHRFQSTPSGLADSIEAHLHHGMKNPMTQDRSAGEAAGNIKVQLVRSSARWSHGIPTEVSYNDARNFCDCSISNSC